MKKAGNGISSSQCLSTHISLQDLFKCLKTELKVVQFLCTIRIFKYEYYPVV